VAARPGSNATHRAACRSKAAGTSNPSHATRPRPLSSVAIEAGTGDTRVVIHEYGGGTDTCAVDPSSRQGAATATARQLDGSFGPEGINKGEPFAALDRGHSME
jgi:hypothetical protein